MGPRDDDVPIEETLRARADVCRFLAGMFIEGPTEESVRALLRPEVLDSLEAGLGCAGVGPLRQIDPDDLGSHRAEFERLFRIPATGFVPTSESVYRDSATGEPGDEGRLYGPSCRSVLERMSEAGATPPPDLGEPPDHVGVEFLFLAYLLERELEARRDADGDSVHRWMGRQHLFLGEHLGAWFPKFAERIGKSAPGGYFLALTQLSQALLNLERRRSGER